MSLVIQTLLSTAIKNPLYKSFYILAYKINKVKKKKAHQWWAFLVCWVTRPFLPRWVTPLGVDPQRNNCRLQLLVLLDLGSSPTLLSTSVLIALSILVQAH